MTTKTKIKDGLTNLFTWLGLHPNGWSVGNAFKVHEFKELVDRARLQPGAVVLDLGCGQGLQTQLLARRCANVVGVDVSSSAIEKAKWRQRFSPVRSRLHYYCSPLEAAGLPANHFDHVFSFCVLEHIPNLDVVLAELARIVKPGGTMHFTVDSLGTIHDPALIARHRKDHSVIEYFTADSIRQRLSSAGFDVTECYPIFTSARASEEFAKRIVSGGSVSLPEKIRLYRELRREDRRNPSPEGIMVLVRARKPLRNVQVGELPAQQESGRESAAA
jgi:ubiquinone/menaquinone biosynthesis C-methylase UbiE